VNYRRYLPSRALASYVECFWFLDGGSPSSPPAIERIVPDACMELIVECGDPFRRYAADGRSHVQPSSFLVGMFTRFILVQPTGRVETMGIRFRPGGARPFFDVRLDELAERTAALDDLLGASARRFEEEIHAARGDRGRIEAAERFLLHRLEAGPRADRRVAAAVRGILLSAGCERVQALGERAGWSVRQLERRFRAAVGLGPKALSRIVRFQNLLRHVGSATGASWAALAAACGYYDQAHLIGDFRRFTGQVPTSFLSRPGEMSRHFTSPERLAELLCPA
jgi:AraC-like DNA-binding protein